MNQNTKTDTITVSVNNGQEELEKGAMVGHLLKSKGLNSRVAVWVNGKQLLLKEYENTQLSEGDHVKILRIVGGG